MGARRAPHRTGRDEAAEPPGRRRGRDDAETLRRYQARCEGVGLGDPILSHYPLHAQTVSMIGVQRRAGRPAFTADDRLLVHLVVGQIDWLHREVGGVAANEDRLLALTPRERQLLLLKLGGTPPQDARRRRRPEPAHGRRPLQVDRSETWRAFSGRVDGSIHLADFLMFHAFWNVAPVNTGWCRA